jgi:hypothetical protein
MTRRFRILTLLQPVLPVVILILIMGGLVDSYALARNYAARDNAGAVTITAAGFSNESPTPATPTCCQPVKTVTLHYTGAQKDAIWRLLDEGHGAPGNTCTNGFLVVPYTYEYTVAFQTLGVTTSVWTRSTRLCGWNYSILGIHERAIPDYDDALLHQLIQLTDGALPTSEHPVYA